MRCAAIAAYRTEMVNKLNLSLKVEDAGPSLNTVSKEDLYRHFLKMQRRSEKYRGKFGLVVNAYKELEKERDKLKVCSK